MPRKRKRSSQGFSVERLKYQTNGTKKESGRHTARFKDHHGVWHRLPAFTDHDASVEYARKLRQLAERMAAGSTSTATTWTSRTSTSATTA